MKSVNKYYRRSPVLKGADLPYDFEIELSKKVYYRKDGALRRADAIFLKTNGWIIISIDNYTITVKGLIKNKWIYEVKNNLEENNDIKGIQEPIK